MNANVKRTSILIGLMALMANSALAGKGGRGKVTGGGSDGCLALGFSAERLDDPDADHAGRITLSVADTCDSKRRGIEDGEARFSVLLDGQPACPEQSIGFDDLGSLESSCEVQLSAADLPARLEACVGLDAEERDGKTVSHLQAGQCMGIAVDAPPSG